MPEFLRNIPTFLDDAFEWPTAAEQKIDGFQSEAWVIDAMLFWNGCSPFCIDSALRVL